VRERAGGLEIKTHERFSPNNEKFPKVKLISPIVVHPT
jgi:hypothetical protein